MKPKSQERLLGKSERATDVRGNLCLGILFIEEHNYGRVLYKIVTELFPYSENILS